MTDDGIQRRAHVLRSLFERAHDALVLLDESGRVREMNAAARALEIDIDALLVGSTPDGDLTELRATLLRAGRASTELRITRESSAARVFTVEGEAHGADHVLVFRDVTERRRLEEEIRHLRRIESLGYMTATVTHDFNNLLVPIVFSSALLADDIERGTPQAALIDEIRLAAERAGGLLRQMLAFVRREPSPPQRVNVRTAVTELRRLIERVVGEEIQVVLDLADDAAEIVVEREQLDHVLLNLAANARDAMPHGGRITIATANVGLGDTDDRLCPDGTYVMLTVTDTGTGMSPEIRERIFERFFTTKEPGRGTGLGLATAHRFATQSGGCISVRSTSGQGTTVILCLPVAPAAAATLAPPRVPTPLPRGTETILVVEDDEHVRRVIAAVLEDEGYEVLAAASGDDAMQIVEQRGADVALVLSDVIMPGMGGPAFVEKLRRAGHRAKALFMSGHTDDVIEAHGVANDYPLLRKAFTPDTLARRVRELLDAPTRISALDATKDDVA